MELMDDTDRVLAVAELPWIGAVRGTLVFVGLCYLFLGVASVPLLVVTAGADPAFEGTAFAAVFGWGSGAFMLCCSGGFGIFNFAAASGLKKGRAWAWYASMIMGAMYAPSICLPFGAVMLYGLLQPGARAVFIDGRRP